MLKWIKYEIEDYRQLLRNVPASATVFFVVSVVLMNLLANREWSLGLSWLALDCGFFVSWMSFLSMDMLTKRFGARASIKLSIFAMAVNLLICGMLYLIMKLPGAWGAYYELGEDIVNQGLDMTFGGTWYVVMGSAAAFLVSAVVNSIINERIGKRLKTNGFRAFAIRSFVSTFIGQFVDNLVFATLVSYVFFGWTPLQVLTCSFTGGLVELLCEVIFSPIGYRANKAWERDAVGARYIEWRASK